MELPEGDPRLVLIAAWTDEAGRRWAPIEPVDTGVAADALPDAASAPAPGASLRAEAQRRSSAS